MNKLFLREDLAKKSVIQGVTSGLDYGINVRALAPYSNSRCSSLLAPSTNCQWGPIYFNL